LTTLSGSLSKMKTSLNAEGTAQYELNLSGQPIAMNERIGTVVRIRSLNQIKCVHCDRITKKSFGQGYCYPCFRDLAQCDMCIVKPETCHFAKGTCREPDWGQKHCMIEHSVYLANSSGAKVGITRRHQKLTRWIDQGAIQAIEICSTPSRRDAGLVEVAIAKLIPDKTNWRKMLTQDGPEIDIAGLRSNILATIPKDLNFSDIESPLEQRIGFPIIARPAKLNSLSLEEADSLIESRLIGIKAQYLILEAGVINIRKFQGYQVELG
jgi:hypothetical protein